MRTEHALSEYCIHVQQCCTQGSQTSSCWRSALQVLVYPEPSHGRRLQWTWNSAAYMYNSIAQELKTLIEAHSYVGSLAGQTYRENPTWAHRMSDLRDYCVGWPLQLARTRESGVLLKLIRKYFGARGASMSYLESMDCSVSTARWKEQTTLEAFKLNKQAADYT